MGSPLRGPAGKEGTIPAFEDQQMDAWQCSLWTVLKVEKYKVKQLQNIQKKKEGLKNKGNTS